MSREIKFRAFHNTSNTMYWFDVMNGNHSRGDGYIGMAPFGEDITITRHRDNMILVDPTECEIMQFTGLLDKTGNEIYEGDKVSYHQFLFDGEEHEETGTGVIKSGEYGWILSNIIHDGISEYMGYSKQDQLDGKVETYLINVYGLHEESFEVLGNIYEKSELQTL